MDAFTLAQTRRHFFRDCGVGLGSMALATLLNRDTHAATPNASPQSRGVIQKLHYPSRAKSVIFLFMAGGPSQLELFEPKPELNKLHGKTIPKTFVEGKRFAFLKGDPKVLGCERKFKPAGKCGMPISDLLPFHREIADDVCWLRGMKTDVFNHGPAKCFVNTGSPQFGRPSMGSWITYGIGSTSSSLPGFVVLQSGPRGPRGGASLWSSGFLPSTYQGVPFLKVPALFFDLKTPDGVTPQQQGEFVDAVKDLNKLRFESVGDPEIENASPPTRWPIGCSRPHRN